VAKRKRGAVAPIDPVRTAIRALHADSNRSRGLATVRSGIAPSLVEPFLAKLLEVPVYRGMVLNHLFPATITDIRPRLAAHIPSPQRDYVWNAMVLSEHVDTINAFVAQKEIFEHSILSSDFNSAQEALDRVRSECGLSLWFLDSQIALYQMRDGLSAQKSYLDTLVNTAGIDPNLACFCYWFSYRAEPNVSRDVIRAPITNIETHPDLSDAAKTFFIYLFDPLAIDHLREPVWVLAGAETTSLIDRYLALSLALKLETARGTGRAAYVRRALELLCDVDDDALSGLRTVYLGAPLGAPEGEQEAFEAFERGEFERAAVSSLSSILSGSSNSSLYELFVRSDPSGLCRLREQDQAHSLRAQVLEAVREVSFLGPGYENALARIERLALAVSHNRLSVRLHAFRHRQASASPSPAEAEMEELCALTGNGADPLDQLRLRALRWGIAGAEAEFPLSAAASLHDCIARGDTDALASTWSAVSAHRTQFYEGVAQLNAGAFDSAIALLRGALTGGDYLDQVDAAKYLFHAYLQAGQIDAAVKLVCSFYYDNQSTHAIFDIERLIDVVKKERSAVADDIGWANLLIIAARHMDTAYEAMLSDAYEDVLDERGVDRPSLMLPQDTPRAALLFFLRHGCSVRVMEDSVAFLDYDDVEAERMTLCTWLARHDPGNRDLYTAELRGLARARQLSSLQHQIESSKMYVDEQGVRSSFGTYLEDSFARYKALLEQPELQTATDTITTRIGKLLEQRDSDKAARLFYSLKLPSTERVGLVEEFYALFLDKFLFSPEFGLDTHLSTNVRHGTFVGYVRGAFARAHLVTAKGRGAREYEPNRHWDEKCEAAGVSCSQLLDSLSLFSRWIDDHLNRTNDDLLQVRRADEPAGLFHYDVDENIIGTLIASISSETTYDEFIELLFSTAWTQTEAALETVQSHLRGEFSDEVYRYLDLLVEGLPKGSGDTGLIEMHDAIAQARTDFAATVEKVCEWFKRSGRTSEQAFPLDIVVDVALQEIRSCYAERDVRCKVKVEVPYDLSGRRLNGIIEILYVLFQNAILHSGSFDPGDLSCEVMDVQGYLWLVVTNQLAPTVDVNTRKQVADETQQRYAEKHAIERVRTEGGSGLSKIWRTAEYNLRVPHKLEIDVFDSGLFRSTVMLAAEGLIA
jgi:hypothetical protein